MTFLKQDFWTVVSKDYMVLIQADRNPVRIAGQGKLVYLTPTVVPRNVADAAKLATDCLPDMLARLEQDVSALKLSGVCDCFDPLSDHLQKIGMLIAAANAAKVGSGPMDEWTLDEPNLRVIRRAKRWRTEILTRG